MCLTLIKKKIKFSSYIRKFRMEQLQSHMWLTASSYIYGLNICAFPHILGSPSSYMTLQQLHSQFPDIWKKISFLFYQCSKYCTYSMCKKTIEEQVWSRGRPYTPLLAFLLHTVIPLIQSKAPFPLQDPLHFHPGAQKGGGVGSKAPPLPNPVAPAFPLRTPFSVISPINYFSS